MKNRAEFIEYVTEFYGPDGFMENFRAAHEEIEHAVDLRLNNPDYQPSFEYSGDTIDREWVRHIIGRVRMRR